jgi:hypothetical protein
MLAAAGLAHPSELKAHHLVRRVGADQIRALSEIHTFLRAGELAQGVCEQRFYAEAWERASAERFAA